jgi:chemotaxis protein CheX
METTTKDRLISQVVGATQDVFTMMLGEEVETGEPFTRKSEPAPTAGILSFIGLAGSWAGTGCISCGAETACRLSSLLLGNECSAVSEEVLDSLAELTNMIIGNVKTALESDFGPMGLSIPTVIFGRNFVTRTSGSDEWVVVPFSLGEDRFEVQLCLAPSRDFQPAGRVSYVMAPSATR